MPSNSISLPDKAEKIKTRVSYLFNHITNRTKITYLQNKKYNLGKNKNKKRIYQKE